MPISAPPILYYRPSLCWGLNLKYHVLEQWSQKGPDGENENQILNCRMFNSQPSTTVMLVSSQRPLLSGDLSVPSARLVPPSVLGPSSLQEPTGPCTRRALLEDLDCPKFELGCDLVRLLDGLWHEQTTWICTSLTHRSRSLVRGNVRDQSKYLHFS